MTLPIGSRVVAYTRDSGGVEQELSVLQQEAEIRAWCASQGLILTRVFTDAARPGSSVGGRLAFEEMIDYLRSGGAGEKAVVVWSYSRFSRQIDDAQYYRADLRRRGYEIVPLQDTLPPGDEGRLMESVLDYLNTRYLKDLSKAIRRGTRYIVSQHKVISGGKPPFGYLAEPVVIGKKRDGSPRASRRLVPDPETAPIVRQIFERRAAGATYAELTAEFGLSNYNSTVRKILKNKVYIGVYEYGEITIPDFCEAIIDLALWHAVQAVNEQRKQGKGSGHPRAVRSRFLLSGLAVCARCGEKLYPWTTTPLDNGKRYRYDYYYCNSAYQGRSCGARLIPKDLIETRLLAALKERILNPQLLDDVYAEAARQAVDGNTQSAVLVQKARRQLQETAAALERILAAIEAHGHSQALLDELGRLERRRDEQNERLASLETDQAIQLHVVEVDPAKQAARILAALEIATHADLLEIVRGLVVAVRAQRQGKELVGEIGYRIPGSSITHFMPL